MTEQTYYPVKPAPTPTLLKTAYSPGVTSVTVESVDDILPAPNTITFYDDSGVVTTLVYSGISSNTLTGLTYLSGNSTRTYSVGTSYAVRTVNGEDINALQDGKLDTYQGTDKAGYSLKVDTDGNIVPTDDIGSYDNLSDKPSINSVELSGDMTASDLGLATESALTAHTSDEDIHVTTTNKAYWNAKQNQVYYQESEPLDAVTGDLWCTDGTDPSSSVSFADITGSPSDNTALSTALDGKISKVSGGVDFTIGVDTSTNQLYWEV